MKVTIRLFGELAELTNGKYVFEINPGVNQTIKDCIERLGIPHTEVYFIIKNRNFVDFSKIVQDGDCYFVYPQCDLPIPKEYVLTPKFEGEPRFVLDIHLGKLAKLLRMFGIYADYGLVDDESIIKRAKEIKGIILTRDRKLLMRKDVIYGYIIRSDFPQVQFDEVLHRYDLRNWLKPFTRCLECNGNLEIVEKSIVNCLVPPRIFETHDKFAVCSQCGKIYWQGTHYEHMKELIKKFLE
ncbi:MAG: Mut7-C RNAse domain-containing protein [Fervidobacterium sp.]